MADFVMPSLGSDMEAGTLVKWRCGVGDRVARGDILAEVETDKGIIEVETFVAGVVEKLVAPLRARVPVGTVLAVIGTGEPASERAAPAPVPAPRPAPAAPRASPAARHRARELDVDLATVVPSSPRGVISIADIERAAEAKKPMPDVDANKRMRRAIAATMARAKREIPHFYLRRTIDVTHANDWLERHNQACVPEERIVLGALICRAVVRAARAVPELNARWTGEEALPSPEVHLGVAISLRNGGLVAPAIRCADKMSIEELMRALTDVGTRARAGTLRSSEMSDATLTLTSLGDRGVDEVLPIIFPPQVAMIGAGTPRVRPWVIDGGLFARSLLDMTVAVDHRVTDGHRAARFLLEIERALMEDP